ncbi:sugar ABC transporter permease [Microbacterium sp. 4R-513]|uniref:carbohydrate ABC transporter permease n=1 Tax=Microbacterium sp. 4R-513 TaxID=2567934 RepID=UPI0013E13772|nr:sugar ABC transporter permease [Microbacterium sp. 4R-513]QIG40122.1 sugar ABC transporter permease [Microbacterium sp. 4R-513]
MTSSTINHAYTRWFLVPAALVFTIFFVLPAVLGLYLSLTNASTLSGRADFIGFANFELLLGDNGGDFLNSIGIQFIYALVLTAAKTVVGVGIALFLNRAFVGRHALRAIVYMPMMFSTIVVGVTFYFLLSQEGLFNESLRWLGLGFLTQDWFGSFDLALYTAAAVETWIGVGWTVVIVLAALQGIPEDVIEAATLDGANGLQMTFFIRIPLVAHAIALTSLLSFIAGMKAFEIIYATTAGGPGTSTQVMTMFIAKALGTTNLGYAAAAQFVQFALIAGLAVAIQLTITRIAKRRQAT